MVRPQFTPQQRAFLVREYHRSNNNVQRVLERFREQYPNVRCPSHKTVYNNVNKHNVNGTSCNLNKGRSGRRRTARTEENIQAVQNAVNARDVGQRIISCRNGIGLSSATFNRITWLDLRFHPYQMIKCHQLLPGDTIDESSFVDGLLARMLVFLKTFSLGTRPDFP
jgi:hypothetical protein